MIPRYPNIASLEASLSAQGYEIASFTSSTIITNANPKDKTGLKVTLDPVTKIANPQNKSPRWQKMPRVGKKRS